MKSRKKKLQYFINAQHELVTKLETYIKHKIRVIKSINKLKDNLNSQFQFQGKNNNPGQVSLFPEPERQIPIIQWNKSDIALLELITALHENNSVVAQTGKLTKKQALHIAEWLFNRPIKAANIKLNKARERKKGEAPFLEELRDCFITYKQRLDAQRENNRRK